MVDARFYRLTPNLTFSLKIPLPFPLPFRPSSSPQEHHNLHKEKKYSSDAWPCKWFWDSLGYVVHYVLNDYPWSPSSWIINGGWGDGAGCGGGDDGDDAERDEEEAGQLSDLFSLHLLWGSSKNLLSANSLLLRNQLQHSKQALWVLFVHPQDLQLLRMPYLVN